MSYTPQEPVFTATPAFCQHVTTAVNVIQVAAKSLEHETHCQMVGMGRTLPVLLAQSQLIDHHRDDSESGFPDNLKQRFVESRRFCCVLKVREVATPVEDVLTMQDRRVIRVMWNVPFLERLKLLVKSEIIGVAEPATNEAKISVAWLIELVENMIAGFVQVEPVALLK